VRLAERGTAQSDGLWVPPLAVAALGAVTEGQCTAACLNQGAKAATPNPASADHLAKIFPNRWVRASGGALFLTPISGDGRCC